MRTCEQCGADAVDERGVCAICGWQSSQDGGGDSSPSLGATRAASVGDYAPPRSGAARATARDEISRGGIGGMPPPLELRQSAPRQTPGATSRFCGACGARLGSDEVFCGQCGTPVGASSGNHGTLQGRSFEGNGSYRGGEGETWMPGQLNAPTEAYSPVAHGSFGPGANIPYRSLGYDRGQQAQDADQYEGSGRAMRIAAGIICLGFSLVSAVLAILLAR